MKRRDKQELHVAITGDDSNDGASGKPLRTIQRAAELAEPGDTVTVHEGLYRERVNPPRGGESAARRITYQAALGENVEIKGSEVVTGWEEVGNETWKTVLPNSFFGSFNPFADEIGGEWFAAKGRRHHTGAVYLNDEWLAEAADLDKVLAPCGELPMWFALVDDAMTTVWAQFPGVDPNKELVEVNARQSIFYPSTPGLNYLTVRGFTMRHAATPWAGAMSEQIGLIGTHWSKGWIIENCTISHSACTGITLGLRDIGEKPPATAEGFVEMTGRAMADYGWAKENVGSHILRNNQISHCEKNGIHGSLGGAFSLIEGNVIHDIHVRQQFDGADQAGIKLLGAIDVIIRGNYVHHVGGFSAIWLDWMAQGTQVLCNLLANNHSHDLFFEVNHGPILVANNLCLSKGSAWNASRGVAFVHNLFAGEVTPRRWFSDRDTPFHIPHSTALAGMHGHEQSGDDRYYNNVFSQMGLADLYEEDAGVAMEGNLFLDKAQASRLEKPPLHQPELDPAIRLLDKGDSIYLQFTFDKAAWSGGHRRRLVDSALLGMTLVSGARFEMPDGTRLCVDTDYFGHPRDVANPTPGPFQEPGEGLLELKVWPVPAATSLWI